MRGGAIVDVHAACVASLVTHMTPRRASEIARALCPPDLVGFLENGRHARNALHDSLARLGERLDDPTLAAPTGEPVVVRFVDARIEPVVPWRARIGGGYPGVWQQIPVPGRDGSPRFVLHSDGRAVVPEYLAVIGVAGDHVGLDEAWSHVAAVTETRPSDALDAALLHTSDDASLDDGVVRARVTSAVVSASAAAPLLVGDVVRTGVPVASLDLTETATARPVEPAGAAITLDAYGDILPFAETEAVFVRR